MIANLTQEKLERIVKSLIELPRLLNVPIKSHKVFYQTMLVKALDELEEVLFLSGDEAAAIEEDFAQSGICCPYELGYFKQEYTAALSRRNTSHAEKIARSMFWAVKEGSQKEHSLD